LIAMEKMIGIGIINMVVIRKMIVTEAIFPGDFKPSSNSKALQIAGLLHLVICGTQERVEISLGVVRRWYFRIFFEFDPFRVGPIKRIFLSMGFIRGYWYSTPSGSRSCYASCLRVKPGEGK
jgi:hypothetical protein